MEAATPPGRSAQASAFCSVGRAPCLLGYDCGFPYSVTPTGCWLPQDSGHGADPSQASFGNGSDIMAVWEWVAEYHGNTPRGGKMATKSFQGHIAHPAHDFLPGEKVHRFPVS